MVFVLSYAVLKPHQEDIMQEVGGQLSRACASLPAPVQAGLSDINVRLRRVPSTMAPRFFEEESPEFDDPAKTNGTQRYLSTFLLDY